VEIAHKSLVCCKVNTKLGTSNALDCDLDAGRLDIYAYFCGGASTRLYAESLYTTIATVSYMLYPALLYASGHTFGMHYKEIV
jgi:hypothetical protein